MRASIAAEQAGIPTVSIVCEGFERQSLATGRGHGLDDMRLGVLVGHVDAQSTALMVDNFMTFTVDQIVAGLTEAQTRQAESSGGEPAALDVGPMGCRSFRPRSSGYRGSSPSRATIRGEPLGSPSPQAET